MPPKRSVLIFTTRYIPGYRAGGPIKSLVHIVDHLPNSVTATVVTADRDTGDDKPYPGLSGVLNPHGRHRIYYLNPRNARHWITCGRAARRNNYDLLYLNSFWSPVFTVLPVIGAKLGILRTRGLLIAPRGELSPGALEIKSTKKRLFLLLWSRILRRADPLFHVSTEMEGRELRQVLPWARTVAQLNSLGAPPRTEVVASALTARFVFISRITPKKNLDLALSALAHVSGSIALDVFGPTEDSAYWQVCKDLIARLPAHVTVTYKGELRPHEVPDTFAQYDAFVFPTRGENFGHVILESLAAGCPVMCSPETPWGSLLGEGGGEVVSAQEATAWGAALDARAHQPQDQRHAAKRAALDAYKHWRQQQLSTRLALEVALDEVEPL